MANINVNTGESPRRGPARVPAGPFPGGPPGGPMRPQNPKDTPPSEVSP